MLVVVRPSGGVVVLVISKKAPRPEWLFPLPEWLGVAPSGSEWLRPVPGPRSAAFELRLKDSACGLAHPPYGSTGSTSAHWCANGAQGIANERALELSCAPLALASVHMCPTGAPVGASGAHVGAHRRPPAPHRRPHAPPCRPLVHHGAPVSARWRSHVPHWRASGAHVRASGCQ